MPDTNLSDLLERAGQRTHVRPPPLEQMLAGARRRRQRRSLAVISAAAVAAVAMVGGATVLTGPGNGSHNRSTPAASHSPNPTATSTVSTRTDVEGTWNVRSLVGPNGQSVLPDSYRGKVRLTFSHGELTGTTGCNDVFGSYVQSGDKGQDLRFSRQDLGSSLVGCSDEPPLVGRLLDVRHVSGSAGIRYLHAENWMIIAELRRA